MKTNKETIVMSKKEWEYLKLKWGGLDQKKRKYQNPKNYVTVMALPNPTFSGRHALVCVKHPIMRDESCATCWEAKDRNEKILNHPIQPVDRPGV